jgi:hypothetical protein
VVAALVFAAGAASGTIVAPRPAPSPGATLEVRAAAPATLRPPKQHSIDRGMTHRRQEVSHAVRRSPRVVWASNVLGVVTRMSHTRVVLSWYRPAGSARVVVLRSRGRGGSRIVYRGRGARYEDRSVRSCTNYRYTLVSYDRSGHRSTGVSSSVITAGCL